MAERKIRSKEERIAEIDKKIEGHKQNIAALEKKKDAILNPKTRARKLTSVTSIVKKAKESGMSSDEIAAKLGIEL